MDKILGGITSLTPIQRDGQDEIIAEWRIGDPNPFSGIDVRMCIDLPTLKKLEDAMKYSNCGIVYMNRLCWRLCILLEFQSNDRPVQVVTYYRSS
jgi:hypothetical protein